MFWRLWRRIFIDEVVDIILVFNLIVNLVSYYFDPTMHEDELRYCRRVLLYRPHRPGSPNVSPWRRHAGRRPTPSQSASTDAAVSTRPA